MQPSASALCLLIAAALAAPAFAQDSRRRERFRHDGRIDSETAVTASRLPALETASEAPTGFDNETNGYLEQRPPFEELEEDDVVPLRSFNDNRFIFEEAEVAEDGLGPTYNAQSRLGPRANLEHPLECLIRGAPRTHARWCRRCVRPTSSRRAAPCGVAVGQALQDRVAALALARPVYPPA